MLVRDIMTREPITIAKDATVYEAEKLLSVHAIGRLIVMDGDKVVGVVTDGDLMVEHDLDTKINEFMSENIISIKEGATIKEAAEIMARHRISGLPVFGKDEKLAGIITVEDIVYRYVTGEEDDD